MGRREKKRNMFGADLHDIDHGIKIEICICRGGREGSVTWECGRFSPLYLSPALQGCTARGLYSKR